jgi:hypothetical protein
MTSLVAKTTAQYSPESLFAPGGGPLYEMLPVRARLAKEKVVPAFARAIV